MKNIVLGVIATLGLCIVIGMGIVYIFDNLIVVDLIEFHSPKLQTAIKNTNYDHILSVGATVQYDANYTIYLKDAYPDSVDIGLIRNGDIIAQTVCFENAVCSIGEIDFQIDDIHIGEHSYMVYWWI